MSEVTRILEQIQSGDPLAAEQLLPLVYDELRRLAAHKMAQEPPDLTLQATALVHEAYMRLVDTQRPQSWDSRKHFFSAASEAMRRILVESARQRRSLKRGGGRQRADCDLDAVRAPDADDRLLGLDEALTRFTAIDADAAMLVRLRYYVALTIPEAAETLGIAPRTADAWWAYARAWLRAAIEDGDSEFQDS
jgi:RNA polymerase sigma factor (TIGR02999 family)